MSVFGTDAVVPGSMGGNRRPVPRDSVPVRALYGSADLRSSDAVPAPWNSNKPGRDPGLCPVCERRGLHGKRVKGKAKCFPHLMQDKRRAAKVAASED